PQIFCRQGPPPRRPPKIERAQLCLGPPPSTIVSPGRVPEHRDKTGRPAHLPSSGPPAAPGGAYGLVLLLLPAGSSCCSPPSSRSFVLATLRALLDPCVAQQEPCSHEGRRGNRQENALDLGVLYS